MALKETLLQLQKEKGEEWISINDLPEELKYVPEVFGAGQEINMNKIKALLYDYNISEKSEIVDKITERKAVVRFRITKQKKNLAKWAKFVELATPNEDGISNAISKEDFYAIGLTLGNGGDFCREDTSTLSKIFRFSKIDDNSKGNSIDAIKLEGYNTEIPFNQCIASWIRKDLEKKNCVMLGYKGSSVNTKIEIDHKDGRKNDLRVSDPTKQKLEDFQPLCKAANDIKRQICKECKEKNERWDAKNIKGNPYSFYKGDEKYTEDLGCVGCYQYDPVAYRISSAIRLSRDSVKEVISRIYPEIEDKGTYYEL